MNDKSVTISSLSQYPDIVQSGPWASDRSLGFEDEDLGSSPGWWAATVATYCPRRPGELPKFLSLKPCEWSDAPRWICLLVAECKMQTAFGRCHVKNWNYLWDRRGGPIRITPPRYENRLYKTVDLTNGPFCKTHLFQWAEASPCNMELYCHWPCNW